MNDFKLPIIPVFDGESFELDGDIIKGKGGGGHSVIPRGYSFPVDASEGDQFILVDRPIEDSYIGLWRYNNVLDISGIAEDESIGFEFICNKMQYNGLLFNAGRIFMTRPSGNIRIYTSSGWDNDIYKDFEVTAEVTDEDATQWLDNTAVKVPRERLFYYDGSEWQLNPMSNLSPYLTHETFKFTLEDGSVIEREACIWNS